MGATAEGDTVAGALVRVTFTSMSQSAGGGFQLLGFAVVGVAVTGANDEVKAKSAAEAAQNPNGFPLMMKQFSGKEQSK